MVNCDKCGKKINDPKDVNVLAFLLVKPVTMCNNCYASKERGYLRHILYAPRMFPINSTPYLVSIILSTLLIIIGILFLVSTKFAQGRSVEPLPFFIIIILFSVVLGWKWVLWFIAKNIVNKVKRKS